MLAFPTGKSVLWMTTTTELLKDPHCLGKESPQSDGLDWGLM